MTFSAANAVASFLVIAVRKVVKIQTSRSEETRRNSFGVFLRTLLVITKLLHLI